MLIALKVIHYLCLIIGGGSSIATLVLQRSLAKTGHKGPPLPAIARTTRVLGLGGLLAITLLWITGIAMYVLQYAGVDLGIWFTIKLGVATVILLISITMNLMVARAVKAGAPPSAILMRRLASAIRVLLLIAIITAVVVFGS